MPEVYNKNYIKEAIFRIDYPPILKLINENPSTFQEQIIELFPNIEVIEHVMRLSIGAIQDAGEVKKIWRFKSRDESRLLEISPDYLVLIDTNYHNFTDFSTLINQVVTPFQANYSYQFIKRIGLRYVNGIEVPDTLATEASLNPYLHGSLLGHLNFVTDKQILKSSNTIEFNYDDQRKVKFRYGLTNDNYPNVLQDSKFTLDFDCYNTNIIDKIAMSTELGVLNTIATEYFETSILDGLRVLMRIEE